MSRLGSVAVLLVMGGAGGAMAKAPPEVNPEACKECHEAVFAGKVTHGPVKTGACLACHPASGAVPDGKHAKGLFGTKRGNKACLGCHTDLAKALKGATVHAPLKKKGCVSCHNPHSSDTPGLLRHDSVKAECQSCHAPPKTLPAYQHGPFAVGACTTCHDPHASKKAPLLREDGEAMCFQCHDAKRFERKVIHEARKKGCTACHSPHGSDQKYFVRKPQFELCGGCHKKVAEFATKALHKHKAVTDPGCGGCHDPHGGDAEGLLRKDRTKLCLDCHAKIPAGVNKHGPVKAGACLECHKPHGSKNPKLLVSAFPEGFYGTFSEERYELCFDCHEPEILVEAKTRKLTRFRDGDRNLHFLHVVAPGGRKERGRSCKACHEIHSGPQAKHIRESVPYGKANWKLPVKYTKTKVGGTCIVGCHSPKTYDRTR